MKFRNFTFSQCLALLSYAWFSEVPFAMEFLLKRNSTYAGVTLPPKIELHLAYWQRRWNSTCCATLALNLIHSDCYNSDVPLTLVVTQEKSGSHSTCRDTECYVFCDNRKSNIPMR